ncbi:MFS transporter [Streptomyces sp. NPDC004752]
MHSPAPGGVTASAVKTDQPHLEGRAAVVLLVTLLLGVLSCQLNGSVVSPALPHIARELNASVTDVSQVMSLFYLSGAICGVVLTRWSDFAGRRRSLIIVLALMGLGTVLCIFAPSLPVLLIGRVLQGTAGAAFQLAYVVLAESVSAKLFGLSIGIITAVNGGFAGVDGWIGGLLTDNFGFRSIFVLIFVVGLIALGSVLFVVPKGEPATPGRMDWWGATSLSVALACLTYYVSQGASDGWFAPIPLLLLAGMIVSFVVFWFVEKKTATPMVAVHHLRSRTMWPVIMTTVIALAGVLTATSFTLVLLSQDAKVGFGLSASTSSLLFLTPPALIGVFAAPLSGWLAGRHGWIPILRLGLLLCFCAMVVISLAAHTQWVVFAMMLVLGITYNGLALTGLNGLGVVQSPDDAPAALPGLNGAGFGIGAGLGISIIAPFAARGTMAGYTTAFWISAVITLLALAVSFLIAPRVTPQD